MTIEQLLETRLGELPPGPALQRRPATPDLRQHVPAGQPRNAVEARICALWRQILNVPEVGPESNFFDLGGYSLHVVRLFHALTREFGTQLPFTVLFEAPTVELLAAAVQHEDLRSFRCLVPVHPYGARTPLFLVHSYLIYEALGRTLGEDQPLYGLLEPPVGRRRPPYRLEDTAELYADAIERLQPSGPVNLAGWCAAGIIALEVARQLEQRGRRIGLLGLIDAWCPVRPSGAKPFHIFHRELNEWKQQARRVAWRRMAAYWLDRALPLPHWLWDASELTFESIRRFEPRPVSAPVLVFRAEEQDFRPYDDAWCGWKPWTRAGVTLAPVPGNHLTMFHEPNLSITARQIRQHLHSLPPAASPVVEEARPCCIH